MAGTPAHGRVELNPAKNLSAVTTANPFRSVVKADLDTLCRSSRPPARNSPAVSHVTETRDVMTSYEEFEAAEAEGSGGFFLSTG